MHVISRKALVEFGVQHPDAARPLDVWFRLMKAGQFENPGTLRRVFASASFLNDGLVVFNIAGNKYRLVTWVHYATATNIGRVWVRHVFTHEQYDRWTADQQRKARRR